MKKSDAFLLNQCFVLLAFVCSLNGLEKMGVCAGIFAIFYSFRSLSKNVFKEDWFRICVISFVELCVFEVSGLNCMYPSLYFLSVSSLVVSFMWSHAGYKARKYGMKWMGVTGFIFLAASIVSPYHRFSQTISLVVTLSIFFPSIILQAYKQFVFYRNKEHRNIQVTVVK